MGKQESILIIGNPVDGFSFIGPFPGSEEATEYAQLNIGIAGWTVAILSAP